MILSMSAIVALAVGVMYLISLMAGREPTFEEAIAGLKTAGASLFSVLRRIGAHSSVPWVFQPSRACRGGIHPSLAFQP